MQRWHYKESRVPACAARESPLEISSQLSLAISTALAEIRQISLAPAKSFRMPEPWHIFSSLHVPISRHSPLPDVGNDVLRGYYLP